MNFKKSSKIFLKQAHAFAFLFSFIASVAITGCAKTGSLSELTGTTAGTTTTVAVTSTGGSGTSVTEFSKLSGDFQSATISSPAALPLKVVLLTSAGLPDPGKSVFFTVTGGAAYGSTSGASATTGSDGVAQITFTAGTQTGAIAVVASTAGQTSVTFTVNVNGVSVYAIAKTPTSNGNSQTGNIGATLASPFKVIVTDISNGSVVPNVTVRFLANQGAVAGSFSSVTYVDILTDASGIATSSTMTLNTTAGSHTIRASLLGDGAIFTDFTATATVPSNSTIDNTLSTLTLSSSAVSADGAANVTATLILKDQYGNLIPNNSQTITPTTTPTLTGNNIGTLAIWDSANWTYASAGTYTRTFSVNTEMGTITFDSISVSGVSLISTLPTCTLSANATVVAANSAITTSAPTLTANGVSTATVIVTIKDFYFNQISNGSHTVIISTDRGTLVSTTLSYHSGSGTYRTSFATPTSVGPGSATFTLVSVDGTAVVGKTAAITLTPGAMTSIVFTTQPAPTSNDAVTAFTTQPIITSYDAFSNIVTTDSSSTVALTAYDTAACAGSVVASGLSGTATITLSSGVGTYSGITAIKPTVRSIKATLGGLTACSSTLTIVQGPISTLSFTQQPAPTSNDTDTAFTTQPVIAAYDASSNLLTNNSSSSLVLTAYDTAACAGALVASGLSGTTSQTLSSGVGTFTNVKAIKIAVKSIKATIGAVSACSSTLTIAHGAPLIAISSGDGSSAAHGSAVPAFVAIVQDANSNVFENSTVDWTITGGGGSLSSASNATNSSGLSASTLTLGALPGTNTAKAALHSNAAVFVTFTATGVTVATTSTWPFTNGTSSSYVPSTADWLSSTLEMTSGGVCRLIATDQIDNSSTEFNNGTFSGVGYATLTDGSTSGLKLANSGSCNGSTVNCANKGAPEIYELSSSWTPQWASMVSYYKMNNNWTDSKGSFNGTASGATFTTTAKVGSHAGSFDGTTNNVNFGTYAITPTGYTIMFWAKRSTISTAFAAFFDMSANGVASGWVYENGNIGFGNANSGWSTWNSVWTDKTSYHHIAIVVPTSGASNVATLYFDGISKGNITVDTSGAWNDVRMGNFSHTTAFCLPGQIDEFATWSTGLTADEVKQIYDRQSMLYSGTFTSRVMDALATAQSWTSLSWVPMLPFFKSLPDAITGAVQNETSTSYPALNTNTLMTGNVGLWHFDEASWNGTASEIKDGAPTPHHGVAVGGAATSANGKLNRGATLDGTDDSLNFGNMGITPTSYSVSFWARRNTVTGGYAVPFSYNSGGYWGMWIYEGGQISFANANGSSCSWANIWTDKSKYHHIVIVVPTVASSNSATKLYYDGALVSSLNCDTSGAWTSLRVGNWSTLNAGLFFSGNIDEFAVWTRALTDGTSATVNEIQQLYQRGASRLKFQTRSCDDNACSGETWKGPDGTAGTYFSELHNMSTQAATPSGTVNAALPTMTLSNFTSPPSTNRYFQYRTILESDSATAALQPELKTVTVDPVHYDNSSPSVYGVTGISYYSLTALTETLGASCSSGVGYNIGKGASAAAATWYWWDSSKASDCSTAGSGAWCTAGGTSTTSNSSTVISTNAAAFSTQLGTGTVYIKAFLKSSGTTACELDSLLLDLAQ